MKKRTGLILVVLLAGLSSTGHAWRDSVASSWAAKPVEVDGSAAGWASWPITDNDGVGIRAMNDAADLYLLINGSNDDGRVLLSGKYRQTITLWFLKSDHRTRVWGINFDFSRSHGPDPLAHAPSFDAYGIVPLLVTPERAQISTAALPSDMALQADLSTVYGRQPVYEFRIPLNRMDVKGRSVFIDLTTSAVTPEVKAQIETGIPTPKDASRHNNAPIEKKSDGIPKPLTLRCTILLSKPPTL